MKKSITFFLTPQVRMDERFNNIGFWQITGSCSNKKLTSRDMVFTKRNNILTQEFLCVMQLPIFEHNTYEVLFEYTELAHSTRGEMLQGSTFLNSI